VPVLAALAVGTVVSILIPMTHLFGALDLTSGKMYGHVKTHNKRA
jgi:hypothetical protein